MKIKYLGVDKFILLSQLRILEICTQSLFIIQEMTPAEMASWLRKGGKDDFRPSKRVMPLELLALRTAVQSLSIDREFSTISREFLE